MVKSGWLNLGRIWWIGLAVLVGVVVAYLPWGWLVGLGMVLIGGGIGFLILREPLLGIGVMLVAAPFGAFENRVWGNQLLDSGQLLFLLIVGVWLVEGGVRGKMRGPISRLHGVWGLFVGVALLSLWDAPSVMAGLQELVKWLEMGLLMVMVVDWGRRKGGLGMNRLGLVVGVLLLAGLSQSLGGIWQGVVRGTGPEHFWMGGRFYRAYGTFDQPNPFGGYAGISACLAIGVLWGILPSFWKQYRQWLLPVLFVGLTMGATVSALILSWSRGAWLGFAAGIGMLVFFLPRRHWLGGLMVIGGVGLFVLALELGVVPASISQRLVSITEEFRLGDVRGVDINDTNYAVIERLAHWQSALGMAQDQIGLGVGFGNYETAYSDYALINWPYPLGHAHNYYLNLLAEIGVAGIITYLIFWFTVFWHAISNLKKLPHLSRGIMLGLLAAWAALAVHHLVDNLYVNNLYLHFGVMLGVQLLLPQNTNDLYLDEA